MQILFVCQNYFVYSKKYIYTESKKDSKDQESMQSSATPVWESNKVTINITNKWQEVSPFPSGNHKAAMNRRESMINTRHK